MPVVVNRSEPPGKKPDKGNAKAAAKPAASRQSAGQSAKSKNAATGLAALDDRTKLIGLVALIVIALVAIALFTGGFGLLGGTPAAPTQPDGPVAGAANRTPGVVNPAAPLRPGGAYPPGVRPGVAGSTPRGADQRDTQGTSGDNGGEGIP